MASVPLDKLMLETDAPFLAPVRVALSEATSATSRAFFKGLE